MVRVKENSCGVEVGKKFCKWEVIGRPFSNGKLGWWAVVRCECGLVAAVGCSNLATGHSTRCTNCRYRGRTPKPKYGEHVNGQKPSRIYNIWSGIKQRCTNQNNHAWDDYGGRGIKMCDERRESYPAFKEWALANGYSDEKQIDRFPDNDGSYEPGNCRFVEPVKNARNKRNNRVIEAFGESRCLTEWAEDERTVVSRNTLSRRIDNGWSPEMAMTQPVRTNI